MDMISRARIKLILSMFIFGTIGLFVRYIPLPSSLIANARGIIGSVFLLCAMVVKRDRFSVEGVRAGFWYICLSGILLGANWILLFEAYRYTSVATATLCYYLAPIIVVSVSPLLLRERLTRRKLTCVAAALAGMVFVSGVAGGAAGGLNNSRGIFMGLGAAMLYATIVILNKRIIGVRPTERTVMQLAISALVLLPYNLLTVRPDALSLSAGPAVMLLFVGIVHTGLAYYLYFGSIEALPAQTLAFLSYIDPVVAMLMSALFLAEPLTAGTAIGAVLILGAAVVSELPERAKKIGSK